MPPQGLQEMWRIMLENASGNASGTGWGLIALVTLISTIIPWNRNTVLLVTMQKRDRIFNILEISRLVTSRLER